MGSKRQTFDGMRQDLGLKQQEFAGIMGVNRTTWANIEASRRRPAKAVLKALYPYVILLQDQPEPELDALSEDIVALENERIAYRRREKIKLTARLLKSRKELEDLSAKHDRALVVLNRLIARWNDPSYTAIPKGLLEVFMYRLREVIRRTSPRERAKVEVRIAAVEGALAHLSDMEDRSKIE